MFTIVVGLNHYGISAKIGEFFGNDYLIIKYGASSYLASNFINNIPMSILFSNLCNTLTGKEYLMAVYSSIIGSNIGAFLTPLGALAGIMFTGLLDAYQVKYGFKDFIKYGFIISLPVLALALLFLFIVL